MIGYRFGSAGHVNYDSMIMWPTEINLIDSAEFLAEKPDNNNKKKNPRFFLSSGAFNATHWAPEIN